MSGRLERVTHVATAPALNWSKEYRLFSLPMGNWAQTASVLAWLASNPVRSCLAISTNAANRLRFYRENVTLRSKDESIDWPPMIPFTSPPAWPTE